MNPLKAVIPRISPIMEEISSTVQAFEDKFEEPQKQIKPKIAQKRPLSTEVLKNRVLANRNEQTKCRANYIDMDNIESPQKRAKKSDDPTDHKPGTSQNTQINMTPKPASKKGHIYHCN